MAVRFSDPGDAHSDCLPLPRVLRAGLLVIIVSGLAFRVIQPGTTAFCEDQVHACALAEDIASGRLETGGLVNSGRFRNLPGFVYLLASVWSIWPDPMALLCFIGIANILAVLGSAWLMRRWAGSVAAWWGTAFLAAGPWAIQYSRWIWAQDLLFPVALLVFLFLWRWVSCGRKWAALGVVLSLGLAVHVHLTAIMLVPAVGLWLLWCRPRLPLLPMLVGLLIVAATVAPYLRDGHLKSPHGQRFGYRHFWRVVPGAVMSVTGLGWQLEFKKGYPAFARSLEWRHRPYQVAMLFGAALLGYGTVLGVQRLWRERLAVTRNRRTPLSMVGALVILIPLSFSLMGIRTSPTYLPVWYPLPFVLMGLAAARLTRGVAGRRALWSGLLCIVLVAELTFFAEQLRYIGSHEGVPGSELGRSYAGAKADVAAVVSRVDAREIWMTYGGPGAIRRGAAVWLLRHADWGEPVSGRALIRWTWGRLGGELQEVVETLPDGAEPPPDAFRIRPWEGPQQRGGYICDVPPHYAR